MKYKIVYVKVLPAINKNCLFGRNDFGNEEERGGRRKQSIQERKEPHLEERLRDKDEGHT